MKKLMCALAAVAVGVTFAEETPGVTSANIVGYQNVQVDSYWSFFTPTFKNISKQSINIDELVPTLTNGVALTSVGKVKLQIFSDSTAGRYSTAYNWVAGIGWSLNGTDKHPDTVTLDAGEGFVIFNDVQVKIADGTEYYGGLANKRMHVPVSIMCSGEVDLICQNAIPPYWSFSGNNSPVARNLDDFVPTLTNGVALTSVGKVKLQIFSDSTAGRYSTAYNWVAGIGWSLNGTDKHPDTVMLEPGQGFVIFNDVQVKIADGTEYYGGLANKRMHVPVFLNYTSPIAK